MNARLWVYSACLLLALIVRVVLLLLPPDHPPVPNQEPHRVSDPVMESDQELLQEAVRLELLRREKVKVK